MAETESVVTEAVKGVPEAAASEKKPEAHPLAGKRVLVTGADSFLGSAISDDVYRGGGTCFPIRRALGCDFRNEAEVLQALLIIKPDVVIHVPVARDEDCNSPGFAFKDILSSGLAIVHACAVSKTKLVIARESSINISPAHQAVFEMAWAYQAQYQAFDFTGICFPDLFGPGDIRSWNPVQQIAEIAIRGSAMAVTDWRFPGKGGGEILGLYVADAVGLVVAVASRENDGNRHMVVAPAKLQVDEVVKEALLSCGQDGSFKWAGESGPWDARYPEPDKGGTWGVKRALISEAVKATVAWRAARLAQAAQA